MANTWFQFKQFIVHQNNSAFKVGTDGVLLGAWVQCNNQKQLLDIGTGTGLIALMLAQKNQQATITAIEIDAESAKMAQENFSLSPWNSRIKLFNRDFLETLFPAKFDHIISNLPFFTNDLKNQNTRKKLARHDDTLPFSDFLTHSNKYLSENGKISFILPFSRKEEIEATIRQHHLHISRLCAVKSSAEKPFHRIMMTLNKSIGITEETELILQTDNRKYTEAAWKLFEGYYLDQ